MCSSTFSAFMPQPNPDPNYGGMRFNATPYPPAMPSAAGYNANYVSETDFQVTSIIEFCLLFSRILQLVKQEQ